MQSAARAFKEFFLGGGAGGRYSIRYQTRFWDPFNPGSKMYSTVIIQRSQRRPTGIPTVLNTVPEFYQLRCKESRTKILIDNYDSSYVLWV